MTSSRWQCRAQHVTGPLRAVVGQLRVEHDTLVFRPDRTEQALFGRVWAVELVRIAAVEVAPRSAKHLLAGGVRRRLAVVTDDGRREVFVVRKPEAVAAELSGLAGPSGGAG